MRYSEIINEMQYKHYDQLKGINWDGTPATDNAITPVGPEMTFDTETPLVFQETPFDWINWSD